MKLSLFSAAATFASLVSAAISDDEYIEVLGNKFFYHNNGSQFYIKGIAYQSNAIGNASASGNDTTFSDPLADGESCKRDLPYLTQLSTNVLRVYAIDATKDHSECLNAFADAGIYIISDLSEPGLSINRADPEWNTDLYKRYTSVVDALGNYTNVLGFFAGNEILNAANNTAADVYVKAAVRDTKAYIKSNLKRPIPVGYSAADVAEIRVPEANFFACGDESESADFYGINMYEWCDADLTYNNSPYKATTDQFKNLTIPLFFSEYGCNVHHPRQFTEVKALYSDDMNDVWSGGIVYMYFQEENDYGLVSVSGNSVSTLQDFSYLSQQLATASPTIRKTGDVSDASSTIACPATGASWAAATKLPPTPNEALCGCVGPAAGCVVADGTSEEDYGDIFGYICGNKPDVCEGITGNGTTGTYGAFVGCGAKDKLNFVLNAYYVDQKSAASACDFSGKASVQKSPKTEGQCSSLLNAAGTAGTNIVSASAGAKPTGSGDGEANGSSGASGSAAAGSGGSKSGSSSGSASGSKSKNAAAGPVQTSHMKVAVGAAAAAVAVFAGAV